MAETRVINLRHRDEVKAAQQAGRLVLVDRRTPWGNRFRIGPDGDRAEVIAKHDAYLDTRPALLKLLPTLRGMVLACWCAPKGGVTADDPPVCHGQNLARRADATTEGADHAE